MHEMSIAVAVVEQVEQAARVHGAEAVATVRVQVGELAGVVAEALDFCFELACAGTVVAGARLLTEPVRARARCGGCGTEWAVGLPPDLRCPGCRDGGVELLAGRELRILDVEWAPGPAFARAEQEG